MRRRPAPGFDVRRPIHEQVQDAKCAMDERKKGRTPNNAVEALLAYQRHVLDDL
jgi:hypothetical protein